MHSSHHGSMTPKNVMASEITEDQSVPGPSLVAESGDGFAVIVCVLVCAGSGTVVVA